jgi:hypothetical protein
MHPAISPSKFTAFAPETTTTLDHQEPVSETRLRAAPRASLEAFELCTSLADALEDILRDEQSEAASA